MANDLIIGLVIGLLGGGAFGFVAGFFIGGIGKERPPYDGGYF